MGSGIASIMVPALVLVSVKLSPVLFGRGVDSFGLANWVEVVHGFCPLPQLGSVILPC